VIAADEDLLTPGAAEVAKQVPGAQLVVVPRAGHAVAIEAGDAVGRAILAHVRGG
jgi:pimeloyl-ACP methyl ester carboxylesterase